MTVSNTTNRTSVVGSGSTGQEVPFSFPITATSDLLVKKRVTATGVETTLVETTNYTVVIVPDNGGTLTTVTAIETTEQIHLIGNPPKTQALNLQQGGSFNAENIEDALDKNTRLSNVNADKVKYKTLTFPETDASTLTTELPSSVDRASKNLTFDSSGNVAASDSVEEGSVSFTTYGENVVGSANALAGKTVLGLDHVFDVRDYGAIGDGSTDDYAAVQAAIDAAEVANGGIVFFPIGTYSIQGSTALLVERKDGIGFLGTGNLGDYRTGTQPSTGSVLAWDGDDDGTLLQVSGCRLITFENLHFSGKDETDNTKTDILVHIVNASTPTDAVGNIYFTNCNFMHAEAGIQCATASGDDNAGDLTMKDCGFKNCITGFLVKNIQGINYLANYLTFDSCTNAFYFEQGGILTANMVVTVDTNWLLKLGAGGRNVSVININGGHGETTDSWNDTYRAGMINCTAPSDACTYIVNITGFSITSEAGGNGLTPHASTYTNVLDDGVVAIFNGCMINAYDFATLLGDSVTDDRTNLVLNNCKFWEGNVTIADYINIPVEFGTHDGANGAAKMTDSSQAWTADELIGRQIINTTDSSFVVITDNDATTVTGTLAGGTDNDWDTGDNFIITQPFFHIEINNCYDSVGRAVNYTMPVRFIQNDTTPDVSTGKLFLTSPQSDYSITDFDGTGENPRDGQIITIIGSESPYTTTIVHDITKINLVGRVDCKISTGDVIVLIYRSETGDWYEVSRSDPIRVIEAVMVCNENQTVCNENQIVTN